MPKLSDKATITAFTGTGLVTVIDNSAVTPVVRQMTPGNLQTAMGGGIVSFGVPNPGTAHYTIPGWAISSWGTGNIAVDQVQYQPMWLEADRTVEAIGFNVTTGAASTARVAIYAADDSMQPGALLYGSATIDVSTAGLKAVVGLSQALSAGRYLLAIHTGATITVRHGVGTYFGNPVGDSIQGGNYGFLGVSKAYAAFSDPGTAWTIISSTSAARLAVRFA